jgi:hypothetical protein
MARKPPALSSPGTGEVRRGGGLWRMPDLLGRVLDPPARRRGLAEARLLTDWPAIAGPELASRSQPVKLTGERGARGGATLVLHCGSAAALELQHAELQLLERINDHFGCPAVARLRLIQAPPNRPVKHRAARPVRTLTADDLDAIRVAVEPLADPGLREALGRLGRTLKAQIEPPEGDGRPARVEPAVKSGRATAQPPSMPSFSQG